MLVVKAIKSILIESNSFLNRKTVNNQKHAAAVVKITLQLRQKKIMSLQLPTANIEIMLKDSQKQKTEIVWALKSVLSGYSNNSCADISKIFTCMFPDSKITKSFEFGVTKLKYVFNFGIATYFRDILHNHLQKSDCFISFDESLNDYTQNCQMDILIRTLIM